MLSQEPESSFVNMITLLEIGPTPIIICSSEFLLFQNWEGSVRDGLDKCLLQT